MEDAFIELWMRAANMRREHWCNILPITELPESLRACIVSSRRQTIQCTSGARIEFFPFYNEETIVTHVYVEWEFDSGVFIGLCDAEGSFKMEYPFTARGEQLGGYGCNDVQMFDAALESYRMQRAQRLNACIKEELMQRVWHPDRLARWLLQDFDPDD